MQRIRERVEDLLYPELRKFGRTDRDRYLKVAAETPLDWVEWIGILAGLVVVVMITRYSATGLGVADRITVAVINFLVAIPLLALVMAPFFIRRRKRGLRSQLHGRSS